jgi:hypothetical protein
MEWNVKYVNTVSGLSNLFSDGQFLKMSYHIVKFCEENLMRSVKNEHGACDVFPVALLQSAIPLFLRVSVPLNSDVLKPSSLVQNRF